MKKEVYILLTLLLVCCLFLLQRANRREESERRVEDVFAFDSLYFEELAAEAAALDEDTFPGDAYESPEIAYVEDGGMGEDTEMDVEYGMDEERESTDAPEKAHGRKATDKGGASDKYYIFHLGMITQEWWEHPDGSVTIKSTTRCYACMGSQKCNICQGTGNGYNMLAGSGRYIPCPTCGGSGRCATCRGQGSVVATKTWQPGEAEAYLKAHREVEQEYRRQGGTRLGKSSRGIRVKEYSPNYTGQHEEVWCEECKKYDAPHIHRWKY